MVFKKTIGDKLIEIKVIINPSLRRLTMRLRPGSITISTKFPVNKNYLDKILKDEEAAIKKYVLVDTPLKNTLHLFGKKYYLELILARNNQYNILLDKIAIYYTQETNITKVIRKMYCEEFSKIDTKSMLDNILQRFKERPGISLSSKINYYKSFFGRYSKQNKEIELSAILAKYPEEKTYHVLCHEVCHYFVFNHSKKFHDLLALLDKDYKAYDKTLQSLNKEILDDYI